ncbi:ATP-binding protein [Caulobacter sp. DWP3-1-3b2]|uniref:ATP-binding protein n=1 Tax=Caulobacter sp. DWP3-1-3b2 TaxID=2804643 RepID=UPI003CF4C9BA
MSRGRSILFQVLAPSLSLVVISFLVLAGVTALSRTQGALDTFRQKIALSASLSHENVTSAVWMLDDSALKAALKPIVEDSDVQAIVILDAERRPILLSGNPALRPQAMDAAPTDPDQGLTRADRSGRYWRSIVPLRHVEAGKSQTLGTMVIVYAPDTVAATVWSGVLWVMVVGLIATGLIVALLVILMRRIAKPLKELAGAMSALSTGALDTLVGDVERHDEIGAMARSVQVFKDNAVKLREAEREGARLSEARAAAEAANRAKGEFLAHMSHELRTPLNGVLTMAQLMAEDDLSAAQRAKLDVVLLSGQDLLHVINDVLDFSKIEAGMLELETVTFDPRVVLTGVLTSFKAVARRKGVHLKLHMADIDGPRRGDPARLRQIVSNYVANALKFTLEGGVDIDVEAYVDNGVEGLKIAVRDTGIGIEQDSMGRLFQRFSQVDASTTRRFGGTGLGLAICRELACQMGGVAWADSAPGKGSTFYVTLPLPRAQDDEADIEASATADLNEGLRILATEDNPTNQAVLEAIMGALGVDLTLAGTGVEVLELWRREPFDLILMDIHMPDMNGLEATREIRAAEARSGRSPIPIIALTANAFAHQITEYAEAGMDDHVSKPIDIQALSRSIERLMAKQSSATVGSIRCCDQSR